ncbi:PorV/PorQ family protein [candidate division KSB1 bacterium]|nr:PorV/PorQ family protein [candidate division KSB1 bacterium]
MQKKYLLRLLRLVGWGILINSIPLCGQEFQKIGTTGFVFLEIPVSARSQALGETGITLPDANADGLYLNPALTALNQKRLVCSVNYSNWYVQTTHQAFGVCYTIPQLGTIGLQAIYFDFGEIEKTINPTASQTGSYIRLGTYSAGAYALGLSYARSLTDKFAFGAVLKYVHESIDTYAADNLIADIGFLYHTGFKSLRIGAFLQSFGLESKYVTEKFKMPQQLKIGFSGEVWGSYQAPNRLTVLVEALHPNDANEHIHLGLENVWWRTFILRLGYKLGYAEENLALGVGLRFEFKGRPMHFDLAYLNHEHLDSTIRYSLAMEL